MCVGSMYMNREWEYSNGTEDVGKKPPWKRFSVTCHLCIETRRSGEREGGWQAGMERAKPTGKSDLGLQESIFLQRVPT